MGATREGSDESLFCAYEAGDASAHEELFRRYQEPLCRHFERMLGDRAAAEDVVIETFLRLHRHRHRFRSGTALRPWIFTIARNLARNRLRAERLQRLLRMDLSNAATAASDRESDPRARARVAAAFAALPTRQREVCSLRLLGEFGLEEIAMMTGVSVGTAKSRLFYGLRRLRALLRDLAPAGGPR
jgi:RNA polymerase sigma-70 factor (ECF subfamily)